MFLIALANYLVITISDIVLDVAKDFTALLIIADFDDIFANTNGSNLANDIVTGGDKYKQCFLIEVTTSHDAKADNPHNKLERDPVYDLIVKDEKARKNSDKSMFETYPRKRPENMRIDFWNDRSFENKVFYLVYRAFRVFHVTIWFYFFPFLALLATYYYPLISKDSEVAEGEDLDSNLATDENMTAGLEL